MNLISKYKDYKYSPIIKKRGFNPKPVAGNIPMFADSRRNPDCIGTVAHADWWNEQIDRCINGYRTGGIHIPGRYYHYLNFVIISGLYGPTYPDFIDLHYEIFLLLEEVKKYKLPGILLPKARRKGLSYFGDAIAMHGMRFISNYRMAVVGGLDNYVQGFRRKLVSTLNNVPPEFMVHTMKLNQDEIAIGVEYKNTSGVWQETKFSDFMFETLQDKANKAEGEFFHDVIFEELGEFEKADSAYESIRPALELGERMEGTFILYGCVCAGTKVWNNKGDLINIEDLKQSEGILGFDGKDISKESITYMQPPAKKECYKITTHKGRSLECSYDHPILWSHKGYMRGPHKSKTKATKFVQAKDIKIGDQVAVIEDVPIFGKKRMWEPRLVGWLIGDGSYGFDKTPVLSNCDDEINKHILKNFDCVIEKTYFTKELKIYQDTRIKGITKQLRKLKIYGQTKTKKILPEQHHSYCKKDICELLGGFFDTDGHVNSLKGGIRITLTSCGSNLMSEVQLLLQKIGIHSNINKIKPSKSGKGGANPYYRLEITDIESIQAFYKTIEFKIKYKQEKLKKINRFTDEKPILIRNGKQSIIRKKVNGLRFERVISIEPIGEKQIYNLTAGNTNTYIANGIVTHNTGGNILKGSRAMKKFYAQHESYGIIPFFVSGARYFYPYYGGAKNRDGTSAEKIPNVKKKHPNLRKEQLLGCEDFYASETKILEVRKQRAINPDKKSLKEWIQKYPLSIEELFTSSGSNNFNNDLLFDCLFKLETNKLLYKPYRLDFVKTDEGEIVQPLQVTVRPVKDDPDDGEIVYIFKMPRLNYKDLDIGGLDGYNEDQTATSDSLGSMVVLRRGDDINVPEDDYYPGLYPVCLYYRRPKRKEIFWETSLKISVLYNLLKNTMIGADADLVIQYYKDQGAKKFLAKRPKAFDSPDGKQMFEFGVKMTAYSKPRLIGVLQSYVESWAHLNVFPLILKDLVAYDDENIGTDWDSADATGYAVMRVIDMKKVPSGAENNERELNKLPYYYEKNGELHQYIPPQKEKPKQAGETTIIHLDKNVWEAFD